MQQKDLPVLRQLGVKFNHRVPVAGADVDSRRCSPAPLPPPRWATMRDKASYSCALSCFTIKEVQMFQRQMQP